MVLAKLQSIIAATFCVAKVRLAIAGQAITSSQGVEFHGLLVGLCAHLASACTFDSTHYYTYSVSIVNSIDRCCADLNLHWL